MATENAFSRHFKTGQADSIYSHGAFFYDQVPERFRKFETKNPTSLLIPAIHTNRSGIHMTLHHMSIQPAIQI